MKLLKKDGFDVVGIKVIGRFDELGQKVPDADRRLRARLDEIPHRRKGYVLDVGLQKEGDLYTQLVGVEVDGDGPVPEGMERVQIPAQRYVYAVHNGEARQIFESFVAMYRWAREEGLTIDPLDFKIEYHPMPDDGRPYELYYKVVEPT